jgi:hypothetical protein
MPRHPPCALQHFTHNKHAQTTKPDTKKQDARIHYATLNTPPHPETHHNHHHTHTDTKGAHHGDALDGPGRERPPEKTTHQPARCLLRTQQRAEPVQLLASCSTQPHPPQQQAGVEITRRKPTTTRRRPAPHTGKLLRKEVIQPHLPVRLPCYDFVPIAGPTFDHSPPTRGLGHGLRVLPTFVT